MPRSRSGIDQDAPLEEIPRCSDPCHSCSWRDSHTNRLDGLFFFFFQAEDGIRDYKVTGVQTCALPILTFGLTLVLTASRMSRPARSMAAAVRHGRSMPALWAAMTAVATFGTLPRDR